MTVTIGRRKLPVALGGASVCRSRRARSNSRCQSSGCSLPGGPTDAPQLIAAIRQGLKETGFAEGENVAIEYTACGHQMFEAYHLKS